MCKGKASLPETFISNYKERKDFTKVLQKLVSL